MGYFSSVTKFSVTGVADSQRDPNYQSFNQMMKALRDLGTEYPIKDAIGQGFLRTDIYRESPEVCRYILWNYEEALASATGPNATIDEHARAAIWQLRASDSIEHIFPQSPGSGWREKTSGRSFDAESISNNVDRIGNLLLLPQPLNSEAKSSPFKAKKLIYQRHHLRMIDEIW